MKPIYSDNTPIEIGDKVIVYDLKNKELCTASVITVSGTNDVYIDRDDIPFSMWVKAENIEKVKV